MNKIICFIVACCIALNSFGFFSKAQQHKIDSITQVIVTDPSSLAAASGYVALSDLLYVSGLDTVKPLCQQALDITQRYLDKPMSAKLSPKEQVEVLKIRALALNNIGYVYGNFGKTAKALEFYIQALKLREEIRDSIGIAESLNNIGFTYKNHENYYQAFAHYERSLAIRMKLKDIEKVALVLNNIAVLYDDQRAFVKAREYYNKALKIHEKLNDEQGIANINYCLANSYHKHHDYKTAREHYQIAFNLQEKVGDIKGLSNTLFSLSKLEKENGHYALAKQLGLQSLHLAQQLKFPESIMNAARVLYEINAHDNDYKEALQMHELFTRMSDSLNSDQNTRNHVKAEMNYEFEKKEAEARKEEEKKTALAEAENNRQKIVISSISFVLLLVIILAGVILRSLRINQRNSKIIVEQKLLVEAKHREISDSINYAERIQRSFLATTSLLDEYLGNYFVFFLPKDVVSGDFYWGAPLQNGRFCLVTADSTGHGVPGAIMSILNISSIEKAVEQGLTEPDDILNHTRINIIERLKKDGSETGGKDGMDCSLIVFDFNTLTLTYAAGNIPIWLVRNGQLQEFPYDNMPIGKHDKDQQSFTQHQVQLQKGDMIYTFTDGLPDQFGGPLGKKYMYKQFKSLLVSISHLETAMQRAQISKAYYNWRGTTEQVDDITVIGVRV